MQLRAGLAGVGARVEVELARRAPAARASGAPRARLRGNGSAAGSSSASAAAPGKRCVRPPSGSGTRLAVARRDPAEHGARRGHRHLLADDRAHAELEAVDASGHAQSGARAHERRQRAILGELGRDGERVGVQVEQPAAARDGRGQVAQVGEAQLARTTRVAGRERDHGGPVLERERAAIGGALDLLDARDRARRQERRAASRRRTARGRAAAARSRPAPPRRGGSGEHASAAPSACGRRSPRTVSLNCRTLPKPAPTATCANGSSVDSISVRADCARCALASATGPAPSSPTRMRFSWRSEKWRRAASPPTPSRSTAPSAINRTARPADVRAPVPGRRTRRAVGVAALAGAEALVLRGGARC